MNHKACLVLLWMAASWAHGQTRVRKLATNINHPSINVSAPYVSLDGGTLVYVSDYGEDNELILNYTTKKDAVNWKDPQPMQKAVNNRLTFIRGFALNENGTKMWISSLKGGGLGGYDIHVSELTGQGWSEPRNLGLPVNSKKHDGAPSLTADENTMYFMRCETMDRHKASGCRLMMAKRNYRGVWEEPTELPAYINTGNSQVPRILGDGVTLLFSSDKLPGNKGGMDLYETRFDGIAWSQPVALAFANTEKDDQYVSVSSLGRHLMKDQPGMRSTEIVELLFPEDLKPLSTMKVQGVVKGVAPSAAYISVFDQVNGRRIFNGQPAADGSFTIFIPEGSCYDLSIEPQEDRLTYFSKTYDLRGSGFQINDRIEATIAPIRAGDEIELAGIGFKNYTAEISPTSDEALRRLARLVKGNPANRFVLDLTYYGYREDSIQSDPDLTEHVIDSSYLQVLKQVPDSLVADSLEYDSLDLDSLQLDSLERDTMITVIIDSLVIRHTYHNDRSQRQTEAILEALRKDGVDVSKIEMKYRAVPDMPAEDRRTMIRLKVR